MESYLDKASCKHGVSSIKKNTPIAKIKETTDEEATIKKVAGKATATKVKTHAKTKVATT